MTDKHIPEAIQSAAESTHKSVDPVRQRLESAGGQV